MARPKSSEKIEIMRRGGRILADILEKLAWEVKPGMTTLALDKLAENLVLEAGVKPSFKEYRGYPSTICTSINEEIVHGLPSERKLKEGDIVGIDLGVLYNGYHTDAAITVPVGKISKQAEKLIKTVFKILNACLITIKEGNYISDISAFIEREIKKAGFGLVRECTGHGIGKMIHEEPSVPNFTSYRGKKLIKGTRLKKGMTLAIEPMATQKKSPIFLGKDGWALSAEKGYTAHFEYTVAVLKNNCQVLTPINLKRIINFLN